MVGKGAEISEVAAMSAQERAQAQHSVAIASREQLLNFLDASSRDWLILNTRQLVEATPFPHGVEVVQQILSWYRDHRAMIGTGRKVRGKHPITGEVLDLEEGHGEALEIAEAERVIRFLLDMLRARDPTWTLARL